MAEVKRAYRRLAKAFHPDSAGEAALPRFLAIHEAYERIRTGGGVSGAVNGGWASTPAEPWRADPSRARAARERASTARGRPGAAGSRGAGGADAPGAGRGRAGSAGAGATADPGKGGATGSGRGGAGSGAAGAAGAGPRGAGPGGAGSPRPGPATGSTGSGYGGRASRRRETRKATLGSTSYDEARDSSDASWSGASWYGPTSGEYWIINPREYADPRKHGPDYQSRARRPIGAADELSGAGPEAASTADPEFEDVVWDDRTAREREDDGWPGAKPEPAASRPRARRDGPRAAAGPPESGAAAGPTGAAGTGASTAGSAAARTFDRRWAGPGPRNAWLGVSDAARPAWAGVPGAAGGDRGAGIGAHGWGPGNGGNGGNGGRGGFGGARTSVRDLLGGPADDPIRRLGLALIAWPPIGLAAAAAISDVTGCSSFSTACSGTDPLLPWLAQAGILGLLLLLPPIARLLAGGAIAVVLALVPLTGFLVVIGGAGAPQAGFVLAVLLAVAWLVGVGWSVLSARRREPPRSAAGPP